MKISNELKIVNQSINEFFDRNKKLYLIYYIMMSSWCFTAAILVVNGNLNTALVLYAFVVLALAYDWRRHTLEFISSKKKLTSKEARYTKYSLYLIFIAPCISALLGLWLAIYVFLK